MSERASYGVLLVEDDPPTRARLAAAVGAHPELALLEAVGTVAEGRAALERLDPVVLLTDLGLPDGSGIELVRLARARGRGTRPMVVTVFGDERHVVSAIEAGALGYLLKDASAEALGRGILEMVAGGSPLSAAVARHLLKRFAAPPEPVAARVAESGRSLSKREREVLDLVVKGFTYGEIAKLMQLSAHTVATYARRIYDKLEVSSRGEAVFEALAAGLVTLDE